MRPPPASLHCHRRRAGRWWGRLLVLAALAPVTAGAQPRFKIVAEDQTWTSAVATSAYLAAHSVAGPTRPVVTAGNFSTEIQFPAGGPLLATGPPQSVFTAVLELLGGDWNLGGPGTQADKLEPIGGTAEARDLAVIDRTEYYLTGLVDSAAVFGSNTGTFSGLTGELGRGFLATGNNGTFTDVYNLDPDMTPHAHATDTAGGFLVVAGEGRLPVSIDLGMVHRYSLPLAPYPAPLPAPLSITNVLLDQTPLVDTAVTTTGRIWIGGLKDGAGNLGGLHDVWLAEAVFAGDQIINDFRAGSEGDDTLVKMERGPHGEVYVVFTVRGRDVSFDALTYDLDSAPIPVASATHAFLGLIRRDGTPAWLTPLGLAQTAGGALLPVDLSVDAGGHAYVTVQGNGTFQIEGLPESITGPGQVTVSGQGLVVDYTRTPALGTARAGAVPDVENRLVLGATGGQSAFSSIETLGVTQDPYFVCYLDPNNPANTVDALSALVTGVGGQVHAVGDFAGQGSVSVSAWLTPDQVRDLRANHGGVLKVLADPLIIEPDAGGIGEVADPGWALARIFNPHLVDADQPSASFFYPAGFVTDQSTARPVRIYVVDKALDAVESFVFESFGGGSLPISYEGAENINVDALMNMVENGDAVQDTDSNHPRQVVHLLAAQDLGSGQGTAALIRNADIYTGGSSEGGNCLTYTSYVSHAINNAVARIKVDNIEEGFLPSLLVIASSGPDPGGLLSIEAAIDQALLDGVPVILSAGNIPGNGNPPEEAADHVPAKYGSKDGVITVGATALGQVVNPPTLQNLNPLYEFANRDTSGDIISLYAPGAAVHTGEGQGFGASSGTSWSCALVAGLAASYLSMNPFSTPAQVEEALVAMSAYDSDRDLHLAQGICAWKFWLYQNGLGDGATCPGGLAADSDGDGDTDLFEFLGGSDPTDPGSLAQVPVDLGIEGTVASVVTRLPHSVVGEDGTLRDGCWSLPLFLQLSDNLVDWHVRDPDSITPGPVTGGLQELRFDIDLQPFHNEKCFLRFEFGQPVSP